MLRLLSAAPILVALLIPTAGDAFGFLERNDRPMSRAVVTASPVPFETLSTEMRRETLRPAG